MTPRNMIAPIALGLILSASPASAQHVSAGIQVLDGPIAAQIVIGQPYYAQPVVVYPRRRIVVVERYAPRVLVVERLHRGNGYWRHNRFRRVYAYYDYDHDVYYDRYDDRYRGLREVALYERDGRFYRDDRDERDYRDYRDYHGRDRDERDYRDYHGRDWEDDNRR